MATTVNVVGTIATEPRMITPSSGTSFCTFRIASDERRFDREKQSWVEGHTNWFGVVCFRTLASHAEASFKKGDRIIVTGKLRVRSWEKDDRRGTAVEIEAEAIGHDLRWGVSRFEKKVGALTGDDVPVPEVNDPHVQTSGQTAPTAESGAIAPAFTTSQGEASDDGFIPGRAAA